MKNIAYPQEIEELIDRFRQLPGIGRRGAERMIQSLLKQPVQEQISLGRLIASLPEKVTKCPHCGALASCGNLCAVCADDSRDASQICVVENMPQLFAVEASRKFNGVYVVLGGKLDPLASENGENLNLKNLFERAASPAAKEVILALGGDVEARATAAYLAEQLEKYPVKVTRPAQGLPAGANLSFADAATIAAAFEGRK
ncbi:MAG: recombination mediator RecR [Victivallaceae bacterium]|nr:recombination mediator RecR [Victivallaceae bacterium]